PGQDLRGRVSPWTAGGEHEGGEQRVPESLAECLCGEADRLDSTGMPGPGGSAQPRASTSIAEEVHGVLSPLADTLGVRQGCARATGDHAARRDHRDTASGRVAPPL